MPASLPARLLTVGVAVALATGLGIPASADESNPDPSTRAARATQALSDAKAVLADSATAEQRRPAERDATMVLRDLALQADYLPTRTQRQTASRILARPEVGSTDTVGPYDIRYTTQDGSRCGAHICVHWVEDGSADAVDDNDGNLATVPGWVNTTLTTMENVYAEEVTRLGYTAPLGDGTRGGNAKLDVYLGDLGNKRLYGYCATEATSSAPGSNAASYCVLDNNYSAAEYGYADTPLENLQVTAAHEFFHAVQFAYDWTEDLWFMEGTAVWMEDEVYDSVDNNFQYFPQSPMGSPAVPMDFSDSDYQPYGSWIFWKFLSESTGAGAADNPNIVRQVWNAAAGATYSTAALQQVLTGRGSSFRAAFSAFGTWSRNPSRYFSEGASYPAAALANRFTLQGASRSTGQRRPAPDHMTHRFYRITPGSTLTGRWRLHVAVNMADVTRGSVARLVVHTRSGGLRPLGIRLNAAGNGSRDFDFRRDVVSYLELELANTSIRFNCNQGTYQSCRGTALDDNLTAAFNATAVRY